MPSVAAMGSLVILALLGMLATWLLQLNGGWPAWTNPGAARIGAAGGVVAAWLGGCALLWRARTAPRVRDDDVAAGAAAFLVACASQTGFAEQLAAQTVAFLRGAGMPVRFASLAELDVGALLQARHLLIVASTTGEGDAPDSAAVFVRDVLVTRLPLAHLRYALLALGDRDYRDFCAFGHRLDAWLKACAAQPLFDLVEVDDGDEAALRHWQQQLARLAGRDGGASRERPRYARWRLTERRLLNPGSAGGACFHLALAPPAGEALAWRAGDVAEIGPRHAPGEVERTLRELALDGAVMVTGEPLRERLARSRLPTLPEASGLSPAQIAGRLRPLPHRDYSIASLPADGAIHLLVRRWRHADGSYGLGAGWLTQHARIGEAIDLRIRSNTNFHAPADERPLILIGNGSGIAGLRGLLAERVAAGHRRNWLLFGERHAASDFHYRDDIERWRADGFIERLDLAFSRDQAERIYVQQRLRDRAGLLREWVAAGAAVYVCGSRDGMAPGVEAVLVESLGREGLDALRAAGCYRRDVY